MESRTETAPSFELFATLNSRQMTTGEVLFDIYWQIGGWVKSLIFMGNLANIHKHPQEGNSHPVAYYSQGMMKSWVKGQLYGVFWPISLPLFMYDLVWKRDVKRHLVPGSFL